MILKCVHQLVTDNVPCGLIGLHHRHYYAIFQTFSNTACSYANFTINSCCLLEIGVIGIENNRIRLPESIPENLLMDSIPKLAFLCKTFYGAIVFNVIVDLEM